MNLKEFYETNTINNCNICSNKISEYLIENQIRKQCINKPYLNEDSIYSKLHFFIKSMKWEDEKICIYLFINKIKNIEIFYKEFHNIDGGILDSFIFNSNNIVYFNDGYNIDQCKGKEKATSLKLEFCHNNIVSEKSIEKLKTLYLFG